MRGRRGFGIIEMMLAVFLLALGISTAAYVIPMSSRGLTQSRIMTQAAFFAQSRLEEALTSPTMTSIKVDPDNPELTGLIQRVSYSLDPQLVYAKAIVYRSSDPARRPMIELESMVGGK